MLERPQDSRKAARARVPWPALVPDDVVHVRKLGADGAERLAWRSTVLLAEGARLVVRSEFALPRVELGCVTLRRGDVWVEFYWGGRWYTVAQVSAADGALKGWYGDVCMPPRWHPPGARDAATPPAAAGGLSYVDLELDLWRGADGALTLLDEREYAQRRAAGQFTPAQVRGAERGWAELRALAERGLLPRWP